MSTPQPEVIILTGMKRSEIADFTKILQLCGYSQGALTAAGTNEEAVSGETTAIEALNERLLAALGAQWDNIPSWKHLPSMQAIDELKWLQQAFLQEGLDAWEETFAGTQGKVVVGDPQFCITLSFWLEVATQSGYSPRVFLLHTQLADLAEDFQRSHNYPLEKTISLWVRYMGCLLRRMPEHSRIIRSESFYDQVEPVLEDYGLEIEDGKAADLQQALVAPNRRVGERFILRPKDTPRLALNVNKYLSERKRILHNEDWEQVTGRLRWIISGSDELSGNYYLLGQLTPPVLASPPRTGTRRVIFHSHIFKNAGTSVDEILKRNFGANWCNVEFPTSDFESYSDQVHSFLVANTGYDAVSSHTGNWWLDYETPGLEVFPIVFVRHPLLRIASAYSFERKQQAETSGSQLAKATDLAGYIQARLDIETDFAFKNFQSRRLSRFISKRSVNVAHDAREAFEKLPFVGLVEAFDQSAEALEKYLKPAFPDFQSFSTQKNVTEHRSLSIADRVEEMREEIGEPLFDRLSRINRVDMELFQMASRRYDFDPAA